MTVPYHAAHGPTLTVAIVDDAELVSGGLRTILSGHPTLRLVTLDSREQVRRRIDLALYDAFRAGHFDRIVIERLLHDPHVARLALYSWETGARQIALGYRAGADSYLCKAWTAPTMVRALERVAAGERLFAGRLPPAADECDWPGRKEGLTYRESEVLELITQGLRNQEIAQSLYLSINSVKSYIRSTYRKIGAERRSQAVIWAVNHGFGCPIGR